MTPAETLYRLRSLGVEVAARDGRVAVRPAGRVPDDLRRAVRDGEAELLELLANPPRRTPAELLRFAQGILGGHEVPDTFDPHGPPKYAARWLCGKYKGRRIDETPADYLAWALRGMDRLPDITRRAIEAHLGCGGEP